jgi:hypothetical protein
MNDKNNRPMKTGDVVEITGAYFKNDNGLYFVEHSPGDPNWSGRDHCLRRIKRNGELSTAKNNLCFWPISAYVNSRDRRAAANEWNREHAEIEIKNFPSTAHIADYFATEAASLDATIKRYTWDFGEDCQTVKDAKETQSFYRSISDDLRAEQPATINPEQPRAAGAGAESPAEQPEAINPEPAEQPAPVNRPATVPTYYEINEDTARNAHYCVHMSDYKPGSATAEYRRAVDKAAALVEARKVKASPYYHDKLDALLDRYARRLAQWTNDYNRNQASYPSQFISGAGNYNMKKHEKQMSREGTLWKEYDEIKAILNKIEAVGTGAVDLADPHAREMLTDQLQKLQAQLDRNKAMNAYYRKHKSFVGFPGLTAEAAAKLTADFADTCQRCPWVKHPIPDYKLTSLRGKIKRTQARLDELDKRTEQAQQPADNTKFPGGEIVRNTEADRLQIIFGEKPDDEQRDALKQNGFRWSPRYGAWQRQLTQNAEIAARRALGLTE